MSDKETAVFDEAALRKALEENSKSINEMLKKANEEAENARTVSSETKSALEKLTEEANSIDKRLDALEKRGNREDPVANKSLGKQIVESDSFRAMIEGRARSANHEIKTTLTNATINTSQPLVAPDYMVDPYHLPERPLDIWSIIPKGSTSSNIIAFPREGTWTDNTGPQVSGSPLAYTEGATKPESAFTFSQVTRPVQTIAAFLPVSTQFMEDAPALESFLNSRLMYGLRLEMETQCFSGSGSNGNLSGILTNDTAFAVESPDLTGTRKLDKMRSAIRQLHLNEYRPTHFVLHPSDWYEVETVKVNAGTDDRYIIGNPAAGLVPRVWGLPVVISNSQTAGQFTVGDFNTGCMYFEKSGMNFQAAYQDANNFRQNLVTLRVETRGALCVWRTEAFVTGSF